MDVPFHVPRNAFGDLADCARALDNPIARSKVEIVVAVFMLID